MAGRDRWKHPIKKTPPPGPEPPREDNCCCPCLKPESKLNIILYSKCCKKPDERSDAPKQQGGQETAGIPNKNSNGSKKPDQRSDAPKVQQWQETLDIPKGNSNGSKKTDERSDAPKVQQWQHIPKGNSNGSNKNTWSDNMQPDGKQVWTHDQENSDGIPRNMKPSPQNQKISSPHKISSPGQGHLWEDNKQEESKKKGMNTGPNSTNVTNSMDGVYSLEEKQRSNIIHKEEDNDGSYGGTRPDSIKNKGNHGDTRSDPTKSSTFEQASPWKEKENDRMKNRKEDILEDHRKAVHKPEYNHGIDRDKGNHGVTRSDPTKSSTFEQAGPWKEKENDRIKNRQEDILEDHRKTVHKQEYNRGIERDKGNHGGTRSDPTKSSTFENDCIKIEVSASQNTTTGRTLPRKRVAALTLGKQVYKKGEGNKASTLMMNIQTRPTLQRKDSPMHQYSE